MFSLLLGVAALTRGMADPTTDAASKTQQPPHTTIIYRAEIPQGEWEGWKFNPQPNRPATKPEQLDIVDSDGKSPRTFSGRIAGLDSMDGVEVGLVSLVGIPWTQKDTYQWEKVAPDGSFSIADARHIHADKAIAMRGPNTAWTFLRFNFAPDHGARNIVLNAAPSRKVAITASGPDMQDLSDVWVEVFDAYSQVDDRGNELNREWGGTYYSEDAKSLNAVLPMGEVALFVHRDGWAGFYQIVDTRKADHFHFVLMPGAELKIKTVDAAGKPKAGVSANWKNPAAPLSYWEVRTNGNGEFVGKNLVPGTFKVTISGFGSYLIAIQPNSVTDALFQEGKEPVISRNELAVPPE
jgi:hypothetical protein